MSLGTRKTKTEGSGNVLRRRRTILAWGFALPFAVVFCVFMLIPLLSSMAMSFTDITSKDLRTPFNVNFVGLDQYITLFHDHRFLHALGVTGIFVLVGLPITMAIALAFAVALNKGSKHLNAFFRAVFYAPVVASVVAVSVVWRYILQKDGLLNSLLAVFGIAGPDWLHDTRYALPALMVMTIWRNMGTLMIIFLAGLQAIPEELKEGRGHRRRGQMAHLPQHHASAAQAHAAAGSRAPFRRLPAVLRGILRDDPGRAARLDTLRRVLRVPEVRFRTVRNRFRSQLGAVHHHRAGQRAPVPHSQGGLR